MSKKQKTEKRNKRSLGTVIIFAIMICLLVSNAIIAISSYKVSEIELETSAYSNLYSIIDAAAMNISQINETYFDTLEGLAAIPYFRDANNSLADKTEWLNEVGASSKLFKNMIFVDKSGNAMDDNGNVIDDSKSTYFMASRTGKRGILDPSNYNGQLSMIYSVPVYGYDKYVCGVIAGIVEGDALTKVVENLSVGNGNSPFLINMSTGIVVADVNFANVERQANVVKNTTGEMQLKLQDAAKGSRNATEVFFEGMGEMFMAYRPVGGSCPWAVVCYAPKADFLGGLQTILRVLFIVFGVSVVLAIIVGVSITAKSIKPLKIVDKAFSEIATGNADLTQRIAVRTDDEIGSVVIGFNQFAGKLQAIIKEIKGSESVLSSAGKNLENVSHETASSITQIMANIGSVSSQILNQASSVEETAGAVNEIASNIESLEKMIANQSAGVTEASAAVEQMIGNIGSVNNSVEKMAKSFDELLVNTKVGSQKQSDVNEKIKQIEAQSKILQDANQAIGTIASQTNLLAMNAAIEAAHAGDAGKGFSVVADEIRKLSETSSQQTKRIREELKKIKDSIANVVNASEDSRVAFNSVSDKITETDQVIQQIKAAMEEQNAGSRQISQVLHVMNDSTSEVRVASAEMSAGNKAILDEIQQLQNATMAIKDSVHEMEQGAQQINENGASLSEITNMVNESIVQIAEQIGQFKV